ncbi:putative pilus assembly protein FilE [Acinetobacter ihumii]|uniref:putative pilus assembly protein FilE n=1 Tax=Acinetobacter ihumii TaxID=2483802 RepID=UPI00202AD26B
MILVTCGTVSLGYAADFFTIIGPDGRPLVIPRDPVAVKQAQPSHSLPQPTTPAKDSNTLPNSLKSQKSPSKVINQPNGADQKSKSEPDQSEIASSNLDSKKASSPVITQSIEKQTIQIESETAQSKQTIQETEAIQQRSSENTTPAVSQALKQAVKVAPKQVSAVQTSNQLKTDQPSRAPESVDADQHIVELNGEKYVDSEYLEDKEFNLEGKKRFYMMPEGIVDARLGAVRMQPEQREKGVSKSFVKSLLKKNETQKEQEVLALSATYYRLPKEQVVENLETTCFSGKKMKDAKLFNVEKQIGLWPRKPLKDTFDYDVVKLSAPLKQLKLTSYATTDQEPTFYWPFVVFLDKNGCILEGVSGYKNQEYSATMLQHAAIEGTIRLPDQTSYILLTPLASALDVQEKSLSNQGQIKLTAIR